MLNLSQPFTFSQASKKELKIMHISAVIFFGCMCMLIALFSSVIYGMFILAADFVFVIIFPQLTALLYFPKYTNTVGSIAGFFFGLLLRVGAGESVINMPVWIFFPFYHSTKGQLFPFRSFAMITSFITIFAVTFVTRLKYFQRIFKRCEQELCNEEQMGQLMRETSGHLEKENTAVDQDYPDQKSKHPSLSSSEYTLTASSRADFKSDVLFNGHFRKLDDRVI